MSMFDNCRQHFEQLAGCKMIIEKYGSETDLTEDIE
jgi:hypothetical protein